MLLFRIWRVYGNDRQKDFCFLEADKDNVFQTEICGCLKKVSILQSKKKSLLVPGN